MKFRSGPLAVREAIAQILSELDPLGLGSDDLGTIEIVLAEALNNVVEHAYPADQASGPIDFDCSSAADGLHIRIIDDGLAMPGGRIPNGLQSTLTDDLSTLPEGGFGWHLIRQLAQDVEYRRCNEQNILDLRLPVFLSA